MNDELQQMRDKGKVTKDVLIEQARNTDYETLLTIGRIPDGHYALGWTKDIGYDELCGMAGRIIREANKLIYDD